MTHLIDSLEITDRLDAQACLDNLVKQGELSPDASIEDAQDYWEFRADTYCPNCLAFDNCPVVERNQ